MRPTKDLVEIFGFAPNDTSPHCRLLWDLGACQFTGRPCSKRNHDGSITYGVCSVTSSHGECIICPNRLYAEDFLTLRLISKDTFGDIKFLTFSEYIKNKMCIKQAIIALGMHSGHEITLKNLSMDWILANIQNEKLISYTGVEVQSLDITGNYRDTWYAYKNIKNNIKIPKSCHGLNWANVYKRLIPQIIRKSLLYSKSQYVKTGLNFIVPDAVYKKFEEIIGSDIPVQTYSSPSIITVYTWQLGDEVEEGHIRNIEMVRKLRFKLSDFSERFISGPNLPEAIHLDNAVKKSLGVE